MNIVRFADTPLIPASHEDPTNPGALKKVLLTRPDLSRGNVQMLNWAVLPPGKSFRAHYHEDMQEIFIVVNGRVEMQVDETRTQLQRGDAVTVPAKATHRMTNLGLAEAEYLVFGISETGTGKTVVVEKK